MQQKELSADERHRLLMTCLTVGLSYHTTRQVLKPLKSINKDRQDLIEQKAKEIYLRIKDCKTEEEVLKAIKGM